MYVRGCASWSLAAADVYGGGHLLYKAVIAVYFCRVCAPVIRSRDGSVAGLLRHTLHSCRRHP